MRPETIGKLLDVRLATERCLEILRTTEKARFVSDWVAQSSAERQLITIGEAVGRIRILEPGVFDRFSNGREIIALRNLLVHGYDAVDADALYRLGDEPLVTLLGEVDAMLTPEAIVAELPEKEDEGHSH